MSAVAASPDYLLRPFSTTFARNAALVAGAMVVTAIMAQVAIPVPGSPVPVTGQTLALLLVGTTMGPRKGSAAMGLYLLVGALGAPVFADGAGGISVVFGATGGYIVSFLLASAAMGWAAERGWSRTPGRTLAVGLGGLTIVYAIGVPWLAVAAGMGPQQAVSAGLTPFLVGELLKGGVAAGMLPLAWRIVRGPRRR